MCLTTDCIVLEFYIMETTPADLEMKIILNTSHVRPHGKLTQLITWWELVNMVLVNMLVRCEMHYSYARNCPHMS